MGIAGYFLFAEVPQAQALVGSGIIVASTLYIANHERKRGQSQSVSLAG